MPRRGAAARLERALLKSFPPVDDTMFDTRLRDDVIDQHEEERGDVWGKTFHQGLRGRQGGGRGARLVSQRVVYLVCKPQYMYTQSHRFSSEKLRIVRWRGTGAVRESHR